MKAILLDIEGTTTPIDFVHKVLFPYAQSKVETFVHENWDGLADERYELADEARRDDVNVSPDSREDVSSYLLHLIDIDRKSTPLKSIQGRIWQNGYENGELKSVVFDDVPVAFERWSAGGKTIAIYSSGSILAQKLLFRYTDHGDLTQYIFAYFDTITGAKREAESYRKIADEIGLPAEEITFVSDIPAELTAASQLA